MARYWVFAVFLECTEDVYACIKKANTEEYNGTLSRMLEENQRE